MSTDRLIAKLDQLNGHAYRTKNDWMADIASPLYTASGPQGDSFRELVEARLQASPHLWISNPAVTAHPSSGTSLPGESVTAYVRRGADGTFETKVGEPGHLDRSTAIPEGHHTAEPEFTDNGSSMTIKVRGEDPRGSSEGSNQK
jgi:hypothetical protein